MQHSASTVKKRGKGGGVGHISCGVPMICIGW